jgi:hypothetical protein
MHGTRKRVAGGVACAALVAAVAAAPASAGEPTYTVSLTGSATKTFTRTFNVNNPDENACSGRAEDVLTGSITAAIQPRAGSPSTARGTFGPEIGFRAYLGNLRGGYRSTFRGGFTPIGAADPALCRATPGYSSKSCRFNFNARRARGAELQLTRSRGRVAIRNAGESRIVEPQSEAECGQFLQDPVVTTLTWPQINSLRRGASRVASGTTRVPIRNEEVNGLTVSNLTFRYTLRVRRVT